MSKPIYDAEFLGNAQELHRHLNEMADKGFTLHSLTADSGADAGVWVVMVKFETDAGGATVFDFLRACTPERLGALSIVVKYMTRNEAGPTVLRVQELETALRAAVGRVSGGAESER